MAAYIPDIGHRGPYQRGARARLVIKHNRAAPAQKESHTGPPGESLLISSTWECPAMIGF